MKSKTKAKHTPGPWKVTPYGGCVNIPYGNPYEGYVAIWSPDEDYPSSGEDARLIAAGPELLEALYVVWNEDCLSKERRDIVSKAIAKAEGR